MVIRRKNFKIKLLAGMVSLILSGQTQAANVDCSAGGVEITAGGDYTTTADCNVAGDEAINIKTDITSLTIDHNVSSDKNTIYIYNNLGGATVDTLTINAGKIVSSTTGSGSQYALNLIGTSPNQSVITTLNNSGTITSVNSAAINVSGMIGTLNNLSGGVISTTVADLPVIKIAGNGQITNFNNNAGATISSVGYVITNAGTIGTLTNRGTIRSGVNGADRQAIWNNPGDTINAFYNYGTIENVGGTIDIRNDGIVTLFVNGQSGLQWFNNAPVTYKTYITSAVNYGQLEVRSSTWDFDNITYNIAPNSTLTAMTYQDVIQLGAGSTFNNTSDKTGTYFDGSSTWNWTLTYDSANWDLIVSGGSSSSSSTALSNAVAATGNTSAAPAASVIDANANLLALFTGTQQQLSESLSQTLPLLTGGSAIAVNNSLSGMNRVIQARLNTGMSAGDGFAIDDRHVWLKPFGSWTDQNDHNGVSGFEAETFGLVAGIDGVMKNDWRMGIAFGYAHTDVDSNSTIAPQSSDIDIYQLIGYGSKSIAANTELNFQIDLGRNNNNGFRNIAFTNTVASSSYDSHTIHLGLGASHEYFLNEKNRIVTGVRADYSRIENDSYTETGAGLLNLNVNKQTTEAMIISVDGKWIHKLDDNTDFTAKAGVGYDTINEQASITAAFAGAPGAAFVTNGIDPDPWLAYAGLGYEHKVDETTTFKVNYDAEYREDFINQTASLNLRWAF